MLEQTRQKFIHFCVKNACYLVPFPEPETRARLLKNSALFLYVLILLSFQLYLYKISPQILGFATNITATDLYSLTNKERSEAGLPALASNPKLEQAAYNKAQDMFAKNYWAHYAPDGSTTPWQFITGAGYNYKYAGENLARDFDTSTSVVAAWMSSSSHRANIVNGNYQDFGIAAVNGTIGGEETTLVVQMFGTSVATAVASAPSPPPPASPAVVQEPQPQPVVVTGPVEGEVAASASGELAAVGATPLEQVIRAVSPISSPKTVPLGFGFFLLGLFALDEIAVLKGGIQRGEFMRTAENIAHMVILGLLMAIVWLTKAGGIL